MPKILKKIFKKKIMEEIFHGGDLCETGDAGLASAADPHATLVTRSYHKVIIS